MYILRCFLEQEVLVWCEMGGQREPMSQNLFNPNKVDWFQTADFSFLNSRVSFYSPLAAQVME